MSEKTKVDRLIEGLTILRKYDPSGEFDVAHDVFIGPEAKPSPDDLALLESLRWFESEEYDCWCMFT